MTANPYKIAIASNFTIDPIETSLREALKRLNMSYELEIAPFNQIIQQLADPSSSFNRNSSGSNAIFLRVADLIDIGTGANYSEKDLDGISRAAVEISDWLQRPRANNLPLFVFVTPSTSADPQVFEKLKLIESDLVASLKDVSDLYVSRCEDLPKRYKLGDFENPTGYEVGRIPYKSAYYDALGWELSRKVDASRRGPFKVIVLDCDNTLWDGVCGEDGIHGVSISESRRFLQEFVLAQRNTGMIIAICSKNNEADVWELFDARPDMSLKREHISAWRINWNPKSVNLIELANELSVGLDSFIFIDDDAAVCAEVMENCPSVLTIQLPEDTSEIPRLFDHLWCFDRLKVTDEDARRAESYRHQTERAKLRDSSADFGSFLQSLELQCNIESMRPDQLPRVSQLSLRTNQFNSTTVRRSEADILEIQADPTRSIWTVTVKDRFGDYGLVGVVTFLADADRLLVDSFMLSCRVLGRGVEHSVMRSLGNKAGELSLPVIEVAYSESAKNAPFLSFLKVIPGDYETGAKDDHRKRIDTAVAKGLEAAATTAEAPTDRIAQEEAGKSSPKSDVAGSSRHYMNVATYLSKDRPLTLHLNAVDRTTLSSESRAASTSTEVRLTQIWERLLETKDIGVDDNFFELGGDSLLGVSLIVEVEEAFGMSLPLTVLLTSPTISRMATALHQKSESSQWEYLVPIQPNGANAPLFCMHAAGGNVLFYRDLANELGPEQPVYGLQARGVADKSKTAHDNIEEMAADYLKEIRSITPKGPYRLCGSSFGGLVAFEAARQLTRAGQDLEFLGLFDTYGPGYLKAMQKVHGASAARSTFQRAVSIKNQLAEIGSAKGQLEFAWGKVLKFKTKIKRKAIWQRNQFEIEYAKKTGLELPVDILRNHKAIDRALNTYEPETYNGHVTLFRAREQPHGSDPFLGWKKYVSGEMVATEVEGSHGALTVYPFATQLAQKLKPFLGINEMASTQQQRHTATS